MLENLASQIKENCGVKILSSERLVSRRNEVYAVLGMTPGQRLVKYVLKVCINSSAEEESWWLTELRKYGLRVPEVKWHDSQSILMEYIEGMLIADIMDRPELIRQRRWLLHLADWLCKFHASHRRESQVLCVPDLNLRNFIYTGRDIVGIDFETAVWNAPERDLGGLAAFILNSDPMFSRDKYQAVRLLINYYSENYSIDMRKLKEFFLEEMKQAAFRRTSQREFLLSKLEELRDTDIFI